MRKEYDFAKMQGKPNPYAKLLKNELKEKSLVQVKPLKLAPKW